MFRKPSDQVGTIGGGGEKDSGCFDRVKGAEKLVEW